jgi:hypothetical protein
LTDTAVPPPTYGPNGVVIPDEQDVLTGRQADINAAFGGGLDPGLSTPQGQLASSDAAIIGDANALFLWLMNMVDPAFSEGRMQDGIGRIYALARVPGRATLVTATCTGLVDTPIPVGALAVADDRRLYGAVSGGTIGAGGTVDLDFACQEVGPIACPAHSLKKMYQTISGWDAIDNAMAGVPGRYVENRADFEARRRAAVGWQANGPLGAVLGAVLAVSDVVDAIAVDNPVGYARRVRGVTLSGNSIYVCVLGGSDQDIGLAILSHKAPGVATSGSTSVTVEDPNPFYAVPHPTYVVHFQRPVLTSLIMRAALRVADDVPTDAATQVIDAVVPVFMGTGDEARERIGTTVYASRYYPFVEALGAWARRLISIHLLRSTPEATFTGALSGAVLTVSAVSSGTLRVGQVLRDDDGTGGVGSYLVSPGRFVDSRTIHALTSADRVTLDLDEAPTLAEADVDVVFE